MLDEFHFIRPFWLLLLPLGLALTGLLWRRVTTVSNWAQICDPHLMQHLLVGKQLASSRTPFIGLALAWVLASLALAGPAWERLPQPVYTSVQGRVIVFDLSKSMDSPDINPSRLVRARYKLNDLIIAGQGVQQGLVVFAGDGFTVAPLTDDADTLLNLVPSLDTKTVPVQGSRADLGLASAAELLRAAGLDSGEILLIADGISPQTIELAESIALDGYRISVLAVGTAEGAPIPVSGGGLLKDADGNIVIPGLRFTELRRVAQAGNGRYSTLTVDDGDVRALIDHVPAEVGLTRLNDSLQKTLLQGDQWIDKGPWLVLPLLLIAAAAFRRGWILSLLFFYLPLAPNSAVAFGWQDLWQRPDQQAAAQFEAGRYDQVGPRTPPRWQGAAKYRLGDYGGASDAFAAPEQMSADDHYNRGNALARSRALEEAIAAYDEALRLKPDMEDALFNRGLVQDLLNQAQSRQNSEEQSSNQDPSGDQDNQDAAEERETGQSGARDESTDSTGNADQPQGTERAENNQTDGEKPEQGERQPTEAEKESDETPANGRRANRKPAQQADRPPVESEPETTDSPEQPMSEQRLALEQWLKRIPDDPGGLLRRKFAGQYRQRRQQSHQQNW